MRDFIIYGLTDPRTDEIRYVGKSCSGMRQPLRHGTPQRMRHDGHRTRWLRELLNAELTFGVVVLENVESKRALIAAERRWIAFGRVAGWPLTNMTEGGDGGGDNRIWTAESREKVRRAKLGMARPDLVARNRASAGKPGRIQGHAEIERRRLEMRGNTRAVRGARPSLRVNLLPSN